MSKKKPTPVTCPACGETLLRMFRVVEKHNQDEPTYSPIAVCPVCKVGVLTLRLNMDRVVARKPG